MAEHPLTCFKEKCPGWATGCVSVPWRDGWQRVWRAWRGGTELKAGSLDALAALVSKSERRRGQ